MLAATGMLAGAFGAHGLRRKAGITNESVHAWETASHYTVRACYMAVASCFLLLILQVFNGLALMLISMHPRFAGHRFAGPAIATGGLIFGGSIAALVLNRDR